MPDQNRTKQLVEKYRQTSRSASNRQNRSLHEAKVGFIQQMDRWKDLLVRQKEDIRNEYGRDAQSITRQIDNVHRAMTETFTNFEKMGPDDTHKIIRGMEKTEEELTKAIEMVEGSDTVRDSWGSTLKELRAYLRELTEAVESDSEEKIDRVLDKFTKRAYSDKFRESSQHVGQRLEEGLDSKVRKEVLRTFREEVDGFRPQDATAEFTSGFSRLGATLQIRGEASGGETEVEDNVKQFVDRYINGDPVVRVNRGTVEITWTLIPMF